jgi:molybdopterin-guanine dinucleotide biosynthesis protein A
VRVTGIVLCGGRSTRMGVEKALLPFGEDTMLARVARLVGEVVDEVIIVGRSDQALPPHLRVVHDTVANLGPLAAIARGLHESASDLNFVTACDMPLLRPAVIRRLLTLAAGHDACVPVDGPHVMTLCGAYRTDLAPTADALLAAGESSVKALIDAVNAKRVDAATLRDIDPELESFLSCDTPERYQQALARRQD